MDHSGRRSPGRLAGIFPGGLFFPPLILLVLLAGFTFAGCNFTQTSEQLARATQLRETEIDVNVRQTLAALQGTPAASTPESNAPPPTLASAPTIDTQLAAQQTVQAQLTIQAQQATQVAMQTINPPQVVAETPFVAPTPDMPALMKSANILLYEDMIGNLDTNRFM
jgi:hypothetical protein